MAEQDSGERTEEATPKRTQDAKEKGQVARSRELTTALMLIFSAVSLLAFAPIIASHFMVIAKENLFLTRREIFDEKMMMDALSLAAVEGFLASTPIFLISLLTALAGPIALGGWTFSFAAAGFKGSRMSPLKGAKRMFGLNALIELLKAIGKFSVVAVIAVVFLTTYFSEFMSLGRGGVESSLIQGLELLAWGFILVSTSLIVITLIDVPYQIWNHQRQLKMTKQEVKDELKQTEGRPEVKSRIRRLAREFAERRMMESVPQADVVITNPEHYSVAIKYDADSGRAPIVIAKGVDFIALQIRKIALHHDIVMLEAPPLARSLYHTTGLDQEIDEALYLAVAQLLAYVYQVKSFREGKGKRPPPLKDFPIPEDYRY